MYSTLISQVIEKLGTVEEVKKSAAEQTYFSAVCAVLNWYAAAIKAKLAENKNAPVVSKAQLHREQIQQQQFTQTMQAFENIYQAIYHGDTRSGVLGLNDFGSVPKRAEAKPGSRSAEIIHYLDNAAPYNRR